MSPQEPLKVLLVPDSIHWVTGTTAQEIASNVDGIDATICSAPLVRELIAEGEGFFPHSFDAVHFLTPGVATSLSSAFSETTACVTTIHHVENLRTIKSAFEADSVMTVCRQWHEHLVKEVNIPENRLTLVPNGVDTKLFHPPEREERLSIRRKYGIPDDAFVVGFSAKRSSNSSERKGIDILEKLIAASSEKSKSIWWVIRGPGWQPVVSKLRENGVNIKHLPFLIDREDVANSYHLMDAYVVTARIEGGPVPLIEAMSSGLSCITTKVGLAPEIIQDGHNGFLADFNDVDSFSSRLIELENNYEIRTKMGRCARETIVDCLQWKYTLKDIIHLYENARFNFLARSSSASDYEKSISNSKFSSSPHLKQWIKKREFAVLLDLLICEDEVKLSRYLADSFILKNFFDWEILVKYIPYSSASFFYKLMNKINRALLKPS